MTKWIVLGVALGLTREFLVVRYFWAITAKLAFLGSGLTLGIGLLDLLVIGTLALEKNLWLAVGYVIGESIGTFAAVKLGK
jgi:hypothetical protein